MQDTEDQKIKALAMNHQEYKMQAEAIKQQMDMIQASIEDCTNALESIDELLNVGTNAELMIPIGAGIQIYAKPESIEKIVVPIGSGISVEKTPSDAKDSINNRKEELLKAFGQMGDTLQKLVNAIKEIEAESASMQ
ncbi:MAG: prefoldin subunit alpha [Methanosarcinaceae archaeon]|jgi:prefoldin alpha subunit|nr:prefoldin subunit alpha [Methanosarcinaceae archaeon]NKQ38131.1 prefoldin subunit alpha [Methanosarcinales archaeon]